MPVTSSTASGECSGAGDEGEVVLDVLAPLGEERLVVQPLGDDDVRHRIDERDVAARPHGEVVGRLDVRRADEVDPAGVGDDDPGPCAQPTLEPRREDRVRVGGVRADEEDDVGMVDRGEVLGAGRGAEGLAEAVAGGGVADPGAGVDVVVAEGRPHHPLDDVDLLVRAPRGGDAADRADAVPLLDVPEAAGDGRDGLVPRHRPPRVVDARPGPSARAGGRSGRHTRRRTGP